MKVPSGDLARPLDLQEGCWCAMQLARGDVLYHFASDDAGESAMRESLEATRLRCQGRPQPPAELDLEIRSRMYGLGINIVRDAVGEARVGNPELARRGAPPFGIPEAGGPGRDVVKEMQIILNTLGFRPGPEDGIMGPITTEALDGFQVIMGLPRSRELDATAVQLLRNSLFTLSESPVIPLKLDPGGRAPAGP
jgi:hypothetical protein